MDKSDAVSQKSYKSNRSGRSGRNLHTYTPRSHEDLLRSHLELDAARKARLENDLQKLAADNERLRRDLELTRQELQDKEQRITNLTSTIRGGPVSEQKSHHRPSLTIDGKTVTIDDLLHHFNEIIQRHHDLLSRKNQYIQDLQNELNNQPKEKRVEYAPPTKHYDQDALQQSLMNEFTNQLTLIRKEYEQVEHILVNRNEKLEQLIQELQNKLDSYAEEIQYLRDTLGNQQPQHPTQSTINLIQEKQKENEYLKEIISTLKGQQPTYQPDRPLPVDGNEALDEELKRLIENRKTEINKLSSMIHEIKKETPDNSNLTSDQYDLTEVENECQKMLSDLNDMNDKVNNIIQKLREAPKEVSVQGDSINKSYFIHNLENLKKQCEDEIETLKSQLGDKSAADSVILRGQAVVKIKDPNYLHKKPDTEGELPDDSKETPSNIKFVLYSSQTYGQSEMRSRRREDFETGVQSYPQYKPYSPIPSSSKQQSPFPKHDHYMSVPCEACSEAYVPLARSQESTTKKQKKTRDKSSKKHKVKTPPSDRKLIHFSKTASSRSRTPPKERSKPPSKDKSRPPSKDKSRPPSKDKSKKGGCWGRKSESYNEPYTRSFPEEERVVNVHSPHHVPESTRDHQPILRRGEK